ncbi:hypothetical protein KJ611_03615 [Patescibacteria group bacterium]|nr:hypothetical protein [Patescibacteria group bacterium]MBU1705249.1 hypothetical protein [Patescibacteria group bacterium]
MSNEVIGFIQARGGPVTDMDLADHFNILEDPNRVIPIFRAINESLRRGTLERLPATHPINGGRLVVKLATDAIA